MASSNLQPILVATSQHDQLVNITAGVAAAIPAGFTGLCFLFCQHTTAGLTINENADPDVAHDLLLELNRLVPWRNPGFRHGEGNSAAHIKAAADGRIRHRALAGRPAGGGRLAGDLLLRI